MLSVPAPGARTRPAELQRLFVEAGGEGNVEDWSSKAEGYQIGDLVAVIDLAAFRAAGEVSTGGVDEGVDDIDLDCR